VRRSSGRDERLTARLSRLAAMSLDTKPRTKTRLKLTLGVGLAGALLATAAPIASADYQSDFDKAKAVGIKAYVYGLPLVNMEKTYDKLTSVNVPMARGFAPPNQLAHFRKLADAKDTTVVTPNQDTLYSEAWLELGRQPMVLRVPDTGKRQSVMPMLTPYQENFAQIGSGADGIRKPGDYLITGPRFRGRVPAGLKQLKSPYDRIWMIGRTVVDASSKKDIAKVHAIQDAMRLLPLDKLKRHGWDYKPARPTTIDRHIDDAKLPGTRPGEDRLAFWDQLGASLAQFRPQAADKPMLAELATVGIGVGKSPSRDASLSQGTLDGLRAAVDAGDPYISSLLAGWYKGTFDKFNGFLIRPTGHYGTDYELRAVVDRIGLGALPANVALYPFTLADRTGARFTGAKRYVAHLNAPGNAYKQLPIPAKAFWSLSMYDSQTALFHDNPLNRYVLNDRSNLRYNADGSLDVYLQHAPPAAKDRDNWLPAPAGAFQLSGRLYGTPAGDLKQILNGTGWHPWTILPCEADGFTKAVPKGFAGITKRIRCAA
jgi:hypothetical protein